MAPKPQALTLRRKCRRACCLCALIALAIAGGAAAAWLFAPVPIGAVLTGVAGFALALCAVVGVSWVKYARRYYASARAAQFPCVYLHTNLSVTFYAAEADKLARFVRETEALPPLSARHTREEREARRRQAAEIKNRTLGGAKSLAYPPVCPADLAALSGKKIILLRRTYAENRALFGHCGIFADNEPIFAEE